MSVQKVLDRTGGRIITRPCNVSIAEIIDLLFMQRIGAVMLADERGQIEGILTERDIIRALSVHGNEALAISADELMIRKVVTCSPDTSIEDVLSVMGANSIRHLPVLLNDEIKGLVSIRDILDAQKELLMEDVKKREKAEKEAVQAKEALQRSYENLETRILERTDELRVARDLAENANKAKSKFLANISHELRTPLNAIIGFSEIMRDQKLGPIGCPQYVEYIGDIRDSGDHLLALINNLLDLSKIESGKDELHEDMLDVSLIIRSSIRMLEERAEGKKISIDYNDGDPSMRLYADSRKLKQIMTNLISNSIKFTKDGGKVTIGSWCKKDSGYVIQVEDTGIGIAASEIPMALSQFGQIQNDLTRKYDGTGLGLPLTKSLVEQHGGSFDLQSEQGKGTTVTIRLPATRLRKSEPEQNIDNDIIAKVAS